MSMDRYLVKSYSDNIAGTKIGIGKMMQLLEQYNNAVIVVPSIAKVDETMFTSVLGDKLSKQLIKNRSIITKGKIISLCEQKTLNDYTNYDVYLDLWGSNKSISEIESSRLCKAVILVIWLPQDFECWTEKYKPQVIYDDHFYFKMV
ncbi:hypothetical protein UB37_19450 [Photobacterium iliopiscarium]|uniref:BREX-3 system P-loop-containing protein BrxF n=1 Tax=Photobacterium iliopiscarium TaxID=56192 RepID=A0ABX5GLS7_9GAMM|nr:hypothetical protein [Photobacterium iliopiscarium]KJG18459.1 hypothetical protein UB37_19450 [Photobacterium iliopiscarium]PSW89083.1 hypothetical protein C9J52_20230 [Photobacterium iliopiscarium]